MFLKELSNILNSIFSQGLEKDLKLCYFVYLTKLSDQHFIGPLSFATSVNIQIHEIVDIG